MTKKAKIKVIKKKDLAALKKVKKTENTVKKEVARDVVTNVSSWVNDFQTRKRKETRKAIKQLLPKQPQADSA